MSKAFDILACLVVGEERVFKFTRVKKGVQLLEQGRCVI